MSSSAQAPAHEDKSTLHKTFVDLYRKGVRALAHKLIGTRFRTRAQKHTLSHTSPSAHTPARESDWFHTITPHGHELICTHTLHKALVGTHRTEAHAHTHELIYTPSRTRAHGSSLCGLASYRCTGSRTRAHLHTLPHTSSSTHAPSLELICTRISHKACGRRPHRSTCSRTRTILVPHGNTTLERAHEW